MSQDPQTDAAGPAPLLHLFEGYGIEIEYMIVDRGTLGVRPIADQVMSLVGGGFEVEVELGPVAWSNELALHVLEMKTNGPASTLSGLSNLFQNSVDRASQLLEEFGAQLMPTGMHPWMDPHAELVLWPHENDVIYRTFDRIFDCRGHGWANLQSMHINLPFADDEEFARLHAAVRLILPILPALAASSPLADGSATGWLDTRLDAYRSNARRIPSVSGLVIPERVFSRQAYETELLGRIYRDLEPLDPDQVLHYEWVNARGAIARFDRMALEIRVLDTQECPTADLAVAHAAVAAVNYLVRGEAASFDEQAAYDEHRLAQLFDAHVRHGDQAVIEDTEYLKSLGYPEPGSCTARELWQHLFECTLSEAERAAEPWFKMFQRQGCLARRILGVAGERPARGDLMSAYRSLCNCLAEGRLFRV